MSNEPFSLQLDKWLKSRSPKTLGNLSQAFPEKSFAVLFLILMAIPALPLPTGGITHVFEIITALLALELVAGRRVVWLPKKWLGLKIGPRLRRSTLPYLINLIGKLEQHFHPRLSGVLANSLSLRFIGLLVLVLTVFAFVAPPFSGLDTLPSLGVVLISLALLLEDFLLLGIGLLAGAVGAGLIISFGAVLVNLFANLI